MKGDAVADKYIYKIQMNILVETLAGCLVRGSYFFFRVKYLLTHIRMSAFNLVHPTQPLVWLEASQDNTGQHNQLFTNFHMHGIYIPNGFRSHQITIDRVTLAHYTLFTVFTTCWYREPHVCFNTHCCPHNLKHCKTKI